MTFKTANTIPRTFRYSGYKAIEIEASIPQMKAPKSAVIHMKIIRAREKMRLSENRLATIYTDREGKTGILRKRYAMYVAAKPITKAKKDFICAPSLKFCTKFDNLAEDAHGFIFYIMF